MALGNHFWGPPVRGEFPAYPPDQIPAGGARTLRNLLVDQPGAVLPRGGIGGPAASDGGSITNPAGATLAGTLPFYGGIFTSYREIQAAPHVDAWRVPINRPTSAADLAQPAVGVGGIQFVDTDTGTVTALPTAGGTDRIPGFRFALLDEFVYHVSLGGPSTAIPTGVAQATRVNKNQTLPVFNGIRLDQGPTFVQDVITHYSRMFVAAARAPGAVTGYDPSLLFFTKVGGTVGIVDQLSDWQDPVSGLVNTIHVGAANDGDFIVALGRANGNLVIFKRRSVWIMYGTSVEDFTLRQLRTGSGCVDPSSVVVADEGVYFASQAGFERFDGFKFTLLSDPVSETWLEFSNRGPAAATVNHAYIRTTLLPNNYLFIALGVDNTTAFSADGAERNWLFYTPTQSWIDVQTAISSLGLGAPGAFNRAVPSSGTVTLWGAAKWARADRLTYGPDVAVGVRDRDATTSFAVDLSWRTGLADLGRVWNTVQLSHLTADYHHEWSSETPADEDVFGSIQMRDSATLLGDVLTLPGNRPSTAPLRRRPVKDQFPEAPHGDVEAFFQSNIGSVASPRNGVLALYGIGVEFGPGQPRRS